MTMPQIPTFADTEVTGCSEGDFLLLLRGQRSGCGSLDWFREHRQAVMAALDNHGAVFFRGFEIDTRQFQDALDILKPEHFEMIDVVTPRSHVRDTLYTSTQAHPAIRIAQHQEMAYHMYPPWYLGFYCEVPSEGDGLTPVNDLRRLGRSARRLYPSVLDRFIELGVKYVRNFNKYSFKSWQTCWETTSRAEVEARLRKDDTEFEWVDDDWLRTFQRRPAVLRDPVSKAEILYPSFGIFHHTFIKHIAENMGLPPPPSEAEQALVCYFGDGSPIPEDFMAWVHEEVLTTSVSIPWQPGDFLLMSNLIAGHGRTPYSNLERTLHASFRGRLDLGALAVARAPSGHEAARELGRRANELA
jgi:alpha-ketoglutarate-dependent taurine dioxygenase